VTTAEEDIIRAECEEWAGGLLYIDSNESRDELRDRICANPDAWWRILQELIAHAPDDQVIQRLAYAPLRMTLECGGERLLREAVSIARTSPRMASAVKGWPSRSTNDLYPLFGRAFVVETLIRHYSQPTGFDFWAWEMARDLIEDDPALCHRAGAQSPRGGGAPRGSRRRARGIPPGPCRGLHRSDGGGSSGKLEVQIGPQLPVRLGVVAGVVRPNRGGCRSAADAPCGDLKTLRQRSERRAASSAG